jgi:hypothetical protein
MRGKSLRNSIVFFGLSKSSPVKFAGVAIDGVWLSVKEGHETVQSLPNLPLLGIRRYNSLGILTNEFDSSFEFADGKSVVSSSDCQPVRFPCLHCGQILSAPAHLCGTQQSCPQCRQLMPVPNQSQSSAAIPPVQMGVMDAGLATSATNGGETDEMWAPGEAAPAEQQSYVPVHCRICDTRMYAMVAEVGKEVVCPDCGAKTPVKMVATKRGQVPPISVPGEGYELSEPAPGLTLELVGYGQPLSTLHGSREREDALLDSARKYVANRKRRKPPKLWMLRGVFLYPFSLGVLPVLLAVVTIFPMAYYVIWLIDFMSGFDYAAAAGSVFLVLVAGSLIGMGITYLAALLLAIVETSSDGIDSLAGEFDLMFADRVLRALFLLAAWAYALAPGEIANLLAGSPTSWQVIESTPLSYPALISLFVLLPVTQLSVLEASSMVVPLSYNLWRGMRRNLGAWVAFYGVSGLIFTTAIGLVILSTKWLPGFFTAWAISFVAILATALYYRLLGRLAWYSAEHTQMQKTKRPKDPYEPLYP